MAPKRRLREDSFDAVEAGTQAAGPSTQHGSQQHSQRRRGSGSTPGRGGVKPDAEELAAMRKKITAAAEHAAAENEKLKGSDILKNLPAGEIESMTGRVIRHMLFSHTSKPGEPVQRQALNAAVMDNYKDLKHASKLPTYIIAAAQHQLIAHFGLEMREVVHLSAAAKSNAPRATQAEHDDGDAAAAAAAAAKGGAKVYVLYSALPAALRREFVQNPADDAARFLHMLVLALVLLRGGKLEHGSLVNLLREVGVDDDDPNPHPHFGKVKEEVEAMLKKRYLSYKVKPASDVDAMYEWGECAESEFGVKAVKAFIDEEFKRMDQRRNAPVDPPPAAAAAVEGVVDLE